MVQNVNKSYFNNYEYSQYTKNEKHTFPNQLFQYPTLPQQYLWNFFYQAKYDDEEDVSARICEYGGKN